MSCETTRENRDPSVKIAKHIKPQITECQVREIVQRLYGLKIQTLKELVSYDDVNYFITAEEGHNNPNIGELWPHGYVFKVLNTRDSQIPKYADAMQALIMYLVKRGMDTSQPMPSVTGQLMCLEKIEGAGYVTKENKTREHIVRLFTYIPGTVLGDVPTSAKLCYDVGKACGKLHRKLQGFHHSFFDTHTQLWDIASLAMLTDYICAVQNNENRLMICEIMKIFDEEVPLIYNKLQKGMIHGDLNEQNILVRKSKEKQFELENHIDEEEFEVCGIIDFGDATDSYLVFDVAIAICYLMIASKTLDPIDIGGHVLSGYFSQMLPSEDEFDVLKRCVEARFCQTLVLGAYSYSLDPSNTYLLLTSTNGWSCLRTLWNTPKDEVMSRWRNILAIYNN